jgi:hypothetical protein
MRREAGVLPGLPVTSTEDWPLAAAGQHATQASEQPWPCARTWTSPSAAKLAGMLLGQDGILSG